MAGAEDLAILATSNELIQQSQLNTFPLSNDPQTRKPFTDPRLAIIAINKDLSRLSSNPYAHETIMALRDWRDRIGQSLKSAEPRPTDRRSASVSAIRLPIQENWPTYLSLGLKQMLGPITGMNHLG
jgi:hypothetical protein